MAARSEVARALSKLGFCSRGEGARLVAAGRVTVNGAVVRDPSREVVLGRDRLAVDGALVGEQPRVYLMLNKPRGLTTTTSDERGRETVYSCLAAHPELPRLFPVGRLDRASEGLLLFTNDTRWADAITDPSTHLPKTYHVQVDCVADELLCARMVEGETVDGDRLAALEAAVLRQGDKNSWLSVVLDQGKNRHIRRLLGALGVEVLRLIRVSIGDLQLGDLAKGEIRLLTQTALKMPAKASR